MHSAFCPGSFCPRDTVSDRSQPLGVNQICIQIILAHWNVKGHHSNKSHSKAIKPRVEIH